MLCHMIIDLSCLLCTRSGDRANMAVMFLCTGLMGCLFSLISYRRKEIQELREAD